MTLGPVLPASQAIQTLLARTARAGRANRQQLVRQQAPLEAKYAQLRAVVENAWAWGSAPATTLWSLCKSQRALISSAGAHCFHALGSWPVPPTPHEIYGTNGIEDLRKTYTSATQATLLKLTCTINCPALLIDLWHSLAKIGNTYPRLTELPLQPYHRRIH